MQLAPLKSVVPVTLHSLVSRGGIVLNGYRYFKTFGVGSIPLPLRLVVEARIGLWFRRSNRVSFPLLALIINAIAKA